MPETSKYREDLPRVSTLVSSLYPFSGTEAEKRFHSWLTTKWITPEEYMKVANEAGTAIHKALEDYINRWEYECAPLLTEYVRNGISFLKEYNVKPIQTECYILCDEYQWTIDLLAEINWDTYVLDWKSWGIAQEILWTKGEWSKYRKPYDKLKKARLQLSLYAHAVKAKKIGVIELLSEWYLFHELKRMTKKELKEILSKYYQLTNKNHENN